MTFYLTACYRNPVNMACPLRPFVSVLARFHCITLGQVKRAFIIYYSFRIQLQKISPTSDKMKAFCAIPRLPQLKRKEEKK